MFSEISSMISGPFVQKIIGFYLEYQIIFNLIVVMYGAILMLAHRNLKKITYQIMDEIGENHLTKKSLEDLNIQNDPFFWKSIIGAIGIPVISSSSALTFHRATRENIIKYLMEKINKNRKIND